MTTRPFRNAYIATYGKFLVIAPTRKEARALLLAAIGLK